MSSRFVVATAVVVSLTCVPAAALAQEPQQEPPPASASSAVPPAQTPAATPRFSGNATLGVSLESGRTDLNGIQFALQGQKPYSDHGAFTMGSTYTFANTRPPGSADRITVANRLEGNIGIEHNYGKHWVLMLRLQGLRDPISHVDYRVQQLTGFGVRFGNRRVQARFIPGLAFIAHDKNVEAENGFNTNIGFYQDLMVQLAPGWTLSEFLTASHDIKDDDDYFFSSDVKLTGAINRRLGIQLSFQYSYESLLPPGVEAWYQKTMAGVQLKF